MKKVLSAVLVLVLCFSLVSCKKKPGTDTNKTGKTTKTDQMKGDEEVKDKDGNVKRYTVESGIITYKLTGAEEGTEILYFKDWGNIEARHKTAKTQLP